MKFKPLHDKVLIKPDKAEEKTESGLYLPPTSQETPSKGIIVATGPGAKDDQGNTIPLSVKEGDHVVYGKYAGSEIKIDGDSFIILEEESILGIIE